MIRLSRQPCHQRDNRTQSNRSDARKHGRRVLLRCSTATWWRSAITSMISAVRARNAARAAPTASRSDLAMRVRLFLNDQNRQRIGSDQVMRRDNFIGPLRKMLALAELRRAHMGRHKELACGRAASPKAAIARSSARARGSRVRARPTRRSHAHTRLSTTLCQSRNRIRVTGGIFFHCVAPVRHHGRAKRQAGAASTPCDREQDFCFAGAQGAGARLEHYCLLRDGRDSRQR